MPSGKCNGCGEITNSATSNWWDTGGKPTECYAAFIDDKWVKGCAFDRADPLVKKIVSSLFKKEEKS